MINQENYLEHKDIEPQPEADASWLIHRLVRDTDQFLNPTEILCFLIMHQKLTEIKIGT